MTFGENLRTLRNGCSLSQKALAEKLGFSFQNISKWERNESLPDLETLVAIAGFFAISTDALLGHLPPKNEQVLTVGENEVRLYDSYPEAEEDITGKSLLSIDGEGKIAAIRVIAPMRGYRSGYNRAGYEPWDKTSSIFFHFFRYEHGKKLTEERRVKIPEGGFVIAVSESDFALKKILQFVIPEEYDVWHDSVRFPGYINPRNGISLFSGILKRNELDCISVLRTKEGVLFRKPVEAPDPLALDKEALAKAVGRELEIKHERKLKSLMDRLEELEEQAEENESRIDDLEGWVEELEEALSRLREQLEETQD